jgi:tetratricopeptide (TPR) repeat protein
MLLITIASTALLLSACSSLPKGGTKVNSIKNRAVEYAKQGNRFYRLGNYARAEKYFQLALDADFSIDDRPGIAGSYNSLGRVYLAVGADEAAKTAFDNAERYVSPTSTPELKALVVSIETGRAEILLQRGDYQGALTILKKAQALPGGADSIEEADLSHDIGAAYKGIGEYAKSLSYLDRALAIHGKLNRVDLEASDLYMIASVHSKQGDYPNAFTFAQSALEKDKLIENSVGIGSDLRALGIIQEKQGETRSAYRYYYASLQVFRTLKMAAEVKDLLERLAKTAMALGETKKAITYRDALKQMEGAK